MLIFIYALIITHMSFIFSIFERTTNSIIAPFKVLKDKTYDMIYNDESETKIQRMYSGDKICEYITFFGDPTQVFPKLYLGSAYNAASYQTLLNYNIKYIINVTSEISNYYSDYLLYYQIPIKDNNKDSITNYLDKSFDKIEEFLNRNDGNILIHCYMGASRSASIVSYYISKKTNIDILQVIEQLKKIRPNINLTHRFLDDLTQ